MEPVERCYHSLAGWLGVVVGDKSDGDAVFVHGVEERREEGEAFVPHVLQGAADAIVVALLGVVRTSAPTVKT